MTTRADPPYDYPKRLAQNKGLEWEMATPFGSFEKKASVTSSVTSASSAGTSTNTSFSARSLATSFDSSVDGNDIAKTAYWDNAPYPPPLPFTAQESKSDLANGDENAASKATTGHVSELPEPMDIDSEYPIAKTPFQAENLGLQGSIEPRTSSALVGTLLAVRLHENPPFGKLFPFLVVWLSLLILYQI